MAEIIEETERPYGGFATTTNAPRSGFDAKMLRDTALTWALALLGSRALVWVATLGGGALWTFAVMNPQPLRLVAALGYCVSVLLPILFRDMRS